jgi:hypothetical protein
MSKFDDESGNIQRAQFPRLSTERNNAIAGELSADASESGQAELQLPGPQVGTTGAGNLTIENNSHLSHKQTETTIQGLSTDSSVDPGSVVIENSGTESKEFLARAVQRDLTQQNQGALVPRAQRDLARPSQGNLTRRDQGDLAQELQKGQRALILKA